MPDTFPTTLTNWSAPLQRPPPLPLARGARGCYHSAVPSMAGTQWICGMLSASTPFGAGRVAHMQGCGCAVACLKHVLMRSGREPRV
eukprot:gene13949-biopygen18599